MAGRMQQAAFELARFHLVLLAHELIDHRDPDFRVPNPVPEFRGEIPLDFLATQAPNPFQQRADFELSALLGKQRAPRGHVVARIALAHGHLVGALVCARRGHRQLVADGPETQETDAELALDPQALAIGFQASLDRIANMGRHILEVR
jgi:hypothetical protein